MRENPPSTRTDPIAWHSPIIPLIGVFAMLSAVSWAKDALGFGAFDPVVTGGIAALLTISWIGGSFRRSSRRHLIALAIGFVGIVMMPVVALAAIPVDDRHQWLVVGPATLAAEVVAVYAYVAVTRLTGFGPPERADV